MRGLAAVLLTYAVLATLIQSTGGYVDLFCLMEFLPPRSIAGIAFWLLQAVVVMAGLAWLWFGAGGEMLARVGPVFTRHSSADAVLTPGAVRMFVTVWLLAANLGVAGLAVLSTPSAARAAECGF